jgi:hypothetical protein
MAFPKKSTAVYRCTTNNNDISLPLKIACLITLYRCLKTSDNDIKPLRSF